MAQAIALESAVYGGRFIELGGRLATVYSPGKDGEPGTSEDVLAW